MIGAIAGIAHIANIVNIADATNAAHIVHVLAASVPSTVPVTHTLPDIPRSYTAICEWAACMVYIAVLYRRVPLRRSIIVSAVGLPAIVAVQYFDGSMPIWFWIVGMLLAFGCMYLTILFGAGTGKREGLYITARAFVLAELVASLHWQIVAFIGTHDARALRTTCGRSSCSSSFTRCVSVWPGWWNATISVKANPLCRRLPLRSEPWRS
mgnify:FL=1